MGKPPRPRSGQTPQVGLLVLPLSDWCRFGASGVEGTSWTSQVAWMELTMWQCWRWMIVTFTNSYKFIEPFANFLSYCLHVCFTRLFFATAEEVAQGHRSPAATQCLDVWTWVVSRCWYVGIGAWIFFHRIPLYQTNALFRTGGVSSSRVSTGFFRSLVDLERWMWPLWPTNPPSGSVPLLFPGVTEVQAFHIFLGPRANKSAGSAHDIPVTDPCRFFWIAKMMLALRLDRWPRGKRLKVVKEKGTILETLRFPLSHDCGRKWEVG